MWLSQKNGIAIFYLYTTLLFHITFEYSTIGNINIRTIIT